MSKKASKRKRAVDKTFSKAFENYNPPTDYTVSEWATANRMLSRENSAEAGLWKNERTPYMVEIMDSFNDSRIDTITVVASSQVGKALAIDTLIPVPNGWKTMEELKTGDVVFDEKGKKCNVISVTDIMYNHKCYELTFSDNNKIIADAEHRWYVDSIKSLTPIGGHIKRAYSGVITTEQMAKTFKTGNRNTYAISVAGALNLTEEELPIPPYTLGAWLGDGNSSSAQITTEKNDIEIIENIKSEGWPVKIREINNKILNTMLMPKINIRDTDFCIRGHDINVLGRTKKGLCAECARQSSKKHKYGLAMDPVINTKDSGYSIFLREHLINNKHIPKQYLRASYTQRLSLLQGIMDTDGTITKQGRCEITLKSKLLIDGVSELLHTLGIKHTVKKKIAICTNAKINYKTEVYRISFMIYDDVQVFRLKRKMNRMVSRNSRGQKGNLRRVSETLRRRIVDIKEVKSVPVKCISVDSPNHLYLAGKAMIPTHNSEMELNAIGYIIDQNPGSILYVHPTKEDAEKFSTQRLAPMIRDTKVLNKKVSDVKSRNTRNTMLQKMFPGGVLTMVGSNSASGLASIPAKYIIGDELDRWALSAGTEGDPWKLAEARTTTFYDKKKIAVSTPTIKDASKIEALFLEGTQERWCTKCPNCGEYHEIDFDNIRFKFDTIKKGRKKDYVVKNVHWACPSCGEYATEHEIRKQPSKWISLFPTAINRGKRSFWLNGFSSPWQSWESIVYEYLFAKDNPQLLKVVYNTKFGKLWEDRGELIDEDTILARRENYGKRKDGSEIELPEGVLVLTCGVDTQDNRLEYEVVGHGHYGETWGIKKGVVMCDPHYSEAWERLDDVIDHVYRFENIARGLKITLTFVDSGGHKTQDVYRECAKRQNKKVFAIKGQGGDGIPYTKPPTKVNIVVNGKAVGKVPLFSIGVDSGKAEIMSNINVKEPGVKYCHFPLGLNYGYDENYFKGLLSEKLVMKTDKGRTRWVWEKIPGHERNEALDCRNYALAAFNLLNPDTFAIEKRLKNSNGLSNNEETKAKKSKVKKNKMIMEEW